MSRKWHRLFTKGKIASPPWFRKLPNPRTRAVYEMIDTVANEAPTAKLALVISYPTSGSGLIVLLKRPQNLKKKTRLK